MLEHIKEPNFILMADGYKHGHWEEIPAEVTHTYEVCVPRKSAKYSDDEIVAFGQTMIASWFSSVRITEEMIDEAEIEITEQGYNFNRRGWERISRELDGKLPLIIMGVEEGRVVKKQTPILAWTNTVPGFAWLCGDVETVIQSVMWKMTTVASICRKVRRLLKKYAEQTGTVASIDYMLHNFGDRSADGPEAAVLAAIAHAALFDGSDCTQTNSYIKKLYRTSKPATSSIEATEHYTMTSNSDCKNRDDWGAAVMLVDRLYAAVERAKRGVGVPMVSGVIDSFDDERFVRDYLGTRLHDRIVNSGGRLIARPDSGDPTTKPGQIATILAEKFGYVKNDKDYAVLHSSVGVIQGDGLNIDTVEDVLIGYINYGFSLDGFCLGMGSGITHDGRRDDFSFSVKAIANCLNSTRWEAIIKDPKTDNGKKSLSGLIRCREDKNGNLETYDVLEFGNSYFLLEAEYSGGWKIWFKNGYRVNRQSFDEVRARAREGL